MRRAEIQKLGYTVREKSSSDRSEAVFGFLASRAVQYVGGLIFVVLFPALLRFGPSYFQLPMGSSALWSVVGCTASLVLGLMIARRLTRYPGTQGSAHIAPVFLATFGLLVAVMFFGRVDFSRYQILMSFALAVSWGYLVHVANKRTRPLHLAVVPFGDVDDLKRISPVNWTHLSEPELAIAGCDGVVADLHAELPSEWEEFLAECALARVPVYNTKEVSESLTGRVQIERLSENNIGSLLTSLEYERTKRAIDLLLLLVSLPVTVPLALVAAVAVAVESPGPILFRQERMGFRGHPFTMLKFRTMRCEATGEAFTSDDDARITRVGRVLRRYRIDELPQIVNILNGEMSWIGPRPESISLSDWYEKEIPFFKYRHVVRPGISGWAQVTQGYASGVRDVTDKLHYDFFYIKHFSPWLDLLIAFKTVRTLLSGFGAR